MRAIRFLNGLRPMSSLISDLNFSFCAANAPPLVNLMFLRV